MIAAPLAYQSASAIQSLGEAALSFAEHDVIHTATVTAAATSFCEFENFLGKLKGLLPACTASQAFAAKVESELVKCLSGTVTAYVNKRTENVETLWQIIRASPDMQDMMLEKGYGDEARMAVLLNAARCAELGFIQAPPKADKLIKLRIWFR